MSKEDSRSIAMSQLETGNMIAINPIDDIKKSAKINKVEPINDLTAYAKWWTYEYWTQPILREPGLVLDGITNQEHASFFGGERDKIFTYASENVRSVMVPFISSDLSVCYSSSVWLKHICYVLYAFLLTIYLAEYWYPDTPMGVPGSPAAACPPTNGKINANMCKFEVIMSSAKFEFRFLIAFILAGYVANAVATWKERRTDYASLCGNTRNLIVNIGSLVPEECTIADDPRGLCIRWTLLAYELAVLKSRGHMDSPQGRSYLEANGDLMPGEWDLLANGDRHTAALFWLQTLIQKLGNNGEMKEEFALKICEDVSSFRSKANDMMSSLNRDRPFPYTALCGLLVKLNVFIFSTWKGIEWSIWLRSLGYVALFDQIRFWADLMVLFVWNVSYMGLYDLGYYLENPFGNRRIDVPHEAISGGLHRLGKWCQQKGGANLPPFIKKSQ